MLDSQPKGDDGVAVVAELDLTAGAGEAAREEDETRKVSLSEWKGTTSSREGGCDEAHPPGTHLQIPPWTKSHS